MKRKFEFESDDTTYQSAKQLKMVPFPNYEPDADVAMSDSSSSDVEAYYPETHHTRLASNTSTSSSSSDIDYSSPLYPRFQLYRPVLDETALDSAKTVGLLQPASSFSHHGSSCSQIPKLRVACSAGPDGQRTMWSFCEQCGAISMVDSD